MRQVFRCGRYIRRGARVAFQLGAEILMKLRFRVNRENALQRGIESSSTMAVIDFDPAQVTPAEKKAIDSRRSGNNVYRIFRAPHGKLVRSSIFIEANGPTLEDLIQAVMLEEKTLH